MTTVQFQADADLNHAIVNGTRRRRLSLNFQSANTANLEGKKDPEGLAIAAQAGRILVTHDRKTMPIEFGAFVIGQQSAGVLIVSQNLPIADAIESIILIWETTTVEEWMNQIMTLPL
jgi:predicted nuclease of predicted toxin-antitoxin system